jgi:hypothetical protein
MCCVKGKRLERGFQIAISAGDDESLSPFDHSTLDIICACNRRRRQSPVCPGDNGDQRSGRRNADPVSKQYILDRRELPQGGRKAQSAIWWQSNPLAACFRMLRPWISSLVGCLLLLAAGRVLAVSPEDSAESPWAACYVELRGAADRHKIPFRILEAVSSAESGREGGGFLWPWPWTVNVAGKAQFFNLREQAAEFVNQAIERGQTNVDIGCMQLNWRYHGAAFKDPNAALQPATNVEYAAKLLAKEYQISGTWADAVARYHSRRAHHAADYRCLVVRRLRPSVPPPLDCDPKTGKARRD